MPETGTTATSSLSGGALAALIVVYLVVLVLVIAGAWKMFVKAGKPGWYAIIPILNTITGLRIAGKSGWWLLLLCIPIVNIVVLILAYNGLAKSFGRGTGFVVGLVFLPVIFIPILGFGSSRYLGGGTDGRVAPQQYASMV